VHVTAGVKERPKKAQIVPRLIGMEKTRPPTVVNT
jgi:hypothetical protein